MGSRGDFHYNQWSRRQTSSSRRFLPVAGTFSDVPANPSRQQAPSNRQQNTAQFPNGQYVSPQQLFQQPPIPFTTAEYQQPQVLFSAAGFQDPLNAAFATSGPVVHEGFIPAPGREDEDESLYTTLSVGYRDSSFLSLDSQSSDENSGEERFLEAEEELDLQGIAEANDLEADKDYSTDDAALDYDEDETLADEDFDDEEESRPKRGKSGGRGSRGGRRGRGTGRGRGSRGSKSIGDGRPGKRGRPKGRRGPRAIADPGPQFKDLQRLANEAYMRKDYATALEYGEKAVQLNPEIFNAHNILSEIYDAMGDEQKSIEALIVGAPTKRDAELWFLIIERVKKIDPREYPLFTEQAKTAIILDCLRSIILLEPDNYEARSRKLEIESNLGHVSRCVKLCQKMLTFKPSDVEVLRIMAMMGTSSPKQTNMHLDKIIKSFNVSIEYFLNSDKDPSVSDLDWELLNIYLDLLDRAGDYDYALSRLKFLSRWIQNRKDETYWDDEQDDREFDIEDSPRRIAVPQFSRPSNRTKYGKTLPLEIRVKMGIFRLRQDPPHFSEAMHHLDLLEPEDQGQDALVWDYQDLFRIVADTLHATGHDREALRFYEPIYINKSKELGLRSYLGLYTCYKNLDEVEKASEIIPILKKWNANTLDDLTVLAKFFEDHDMRVEAMQRGESVYRNGGAYKLRKVRFKGYEELKEYFFHQRKQARGKHGVRKTRVRKYMKKLKKATRNINEDDSANEGTNNELPSLGPMSQRPALGLFRTRFLPPSKPQTFLPVEPEPEPVPPTFEGTDVPVQAIDHRLFRRKLESLASECQQDLKAARAQHREIAASFRRLDDIIDSAENGSEAAIDEYISITRELIEEFSTFDLFYSDRREDFVGYFRRVGSGELWKKSALMALAVIANNVEDGETESDLKEKPDIIPQDFYGIHFDRWCDAFSFYAILLARQGEEERCFSILDVAIQSNIFFRAQKHHHQLEITRLICALAVDDSMQASAAVRWLMREYPFGGDIFRLYSCVNRLCSFSEGFATGPAHKVLMRYIKTMDYVLLTPEQRTWYNFRGNDRTAWMQNAFSSEIVNYVKDHDPALFTLYAHVLAAGGSYMAALNYYFRAFAITPDDPVLSLSIGVAFVQHSMKRLSENRQYQIQQGLAFVNRYYELRTKDNIAIYCSEAEFNLGRIWHSLGLLSQALPAYERCIALSRRVRQEAEDQCIDGNWGVEDFASEAAYAIQTIYALSGNFEGARKLTGGALVIE